MTELIRRLRNALRALQGKPPIPKAIGGTGGGGGGNPPEPL